MPSLFSHSRSRRSVPESHPLPPERNCCLPLLLPRPTIRIDQAQARAQNDIDTIMGHGHSSLRASRHHKHSVSSHRSGPRGNRDLSKQLAGQTTTRESNNPWSPPPYSVQPPMPTSPAATSVGSDGDTPYAFLREFDTIFVVDDSASMRGSRWKETEEAIATIAPICTRYDQDGIDIYFLNHQRSPTNGAYNGVTTAEDVQEIFSCVEPFGATPFGKRLAQILRPYLRRVENMAAATDEDGNLTDPARFVKPLNIIAITDGAFTDDAESIIIDTAKRLDGPKCNAVPWQVGIQFFQIGNDQAARQYLEELDDDLHKKVQDRNLRDIVDTVPWKGKNGQTLTADGILKCVLGAVHKKYDNRKVTI